MTRIEAENIISECLREIRQTLIEYVPEFEESDLICSLYVSKCANCAWMLEEEKDDTGKTSNEYLLHIDDRKEVEEE